MATTSGDKPKILIVDDQPRNLDVLEVMLGDLDCELVRATSPDEALLHLVRNDFAALVLDIRMPGMSGLELAALIKQRKRSQHVPILFLTAFSVNEEDMLRGYGNQPVPAPPRRTPAAASPTGSWPPASAAT